MKTTALETYIVEIYRTKHEFFGEIQKIIVNIPTVHFEECGCNHTQAILFVNALKNALMGTFEEFLSEKMPDAKSVLDRLIGGGFVSNKNDMFRQIQNLKDDIILMFAGLTNKENDAVYCDYKLLHDIRKCFKTDLKKHKHQYPQIPAKVANQKVFETLVKVAEDTWGYFRQTGNVFALKQHLATTKNISNLIVNYKT